MKAFWIGLIAAAVVLVSGPARAQDAKALAQKSGCLACHTEDKKLVGPSMKEIAAKYKGDKGAVDKLAAKIKSGGKGAWGDVAMPPNPVSDDEAKKLAAWVLSVK